MERQDYEKIADAIGNKLGIYQAQNDERARQVVLNLTYDLCDEFGAFENYNHDEFHTRINAAAEVTKTRYNPS